MRSLVLAATFSLAGAPAWATVSTDIAAVEAKMKTCIDKDGSDIGMKMCVGDAFDAADTLLNRTYKAIATQFKGTKQDDEAADDKEKTKRLVASERAWIAYRDAECSLQGVSMLGGTGESLTTVSCLLLMTEQRAKSLNDLMTGNP